MRALSSQHSVCVLCRVLRVSRSTYYKSLNREPSSTDAEKVMIRTRILEIYSRADKRMGVRKITTCLKRDYCICVSEGRVYRLMKTMALPKMSTVKPPKPVYAPSDDSECKNLLKQRFDQPAPNMVWVCDFTYIKVAERFCYVCAIVDLFSRKVIAYKVSFHIDRFLAIDTLREAVSSRAAKKGVIFHTDRGSQFTSKDFRMTADTLGIIQSFSAKGHPYDNAVMECFFKYLKKEETDRRSYSGINELRISLFKYIVGYYNSYRPHSHNSSLSPNEREDIFFNK